MTETAEVSSGLDAEKIPTAKAGGVSTGMLGDLPSVGDIDADVFVGESDGFDPDQGRSCEKEEARAQGFHAGWCTKPCPRKSRAPSEDFD